MANKISTVVDNIEAGLAALVPDTIHAVKRKVINAQTEKNPPVLGISVSRFWRSADDNWHAMVLLQLVTRKGGDSVDDATIDLAGAVAANIQATIDAGDIGGHVDKPVFDTWHNRSGEHLALVGVVATLDIEITGPLTT